MLGTSNAHNSGAVTPSQSSNYIAKMSAENTRFFLGVAAGGGSAAGIEYGAALTEAVPDPVDFEAFVSQCPCPEMADYPYNDLQVR